MRSRMIADADHHYAAGALLFDDGDGLADGAAWPCRRRACADHLQPAFGFNAILGLVGLAGILMRNTLILTEQIKENRAAGLDDYHAVIEVTVQRTKPVILTALAAVLAFVPLTHSVFWGSMAYTLIGGTALGTVLILLFLPALYAAWFQIKPTADEIYEVSIGEAELRTAMVAE